jgi:hypothetical protein
VDGVRDLDWRGFGDDGDVLKSPSFSRFSEGGVCFAKGFRIVIPFSKSNLLSHIRREYNTFSTEGLQALPCTRSYPSLDISLSIVCVCVCRLRPWPLSALAGYALSILPILRVLSSCLSPTLCRSTLSMVSHEQAMPYASPPSSSPPLRSLLLSLSGSR